MRLSEIDPEHFVPLGHKRKALLVEPIGGGYEGKIIIPQETAGPVMSSGLEPPTLNHYRPTVCRVLAIGPNVRGVTPGDIVNVPGAGNCYADLEDGQGIGSRVLIREGDIAFIYECSEWREFAVEC